MSEDIIVTAPELAKWLRITDRAVREIAKEGIIPRAGRGCYRLMESIGKYCEHLREVSAGRTAKNKTDEDDLDLVRERARLASEQADKTAMENAKRRGELVEIAEVASTVSREYTIVRTHLLALPSKLAAQIALLNTPAEVDDALRAAINEALEALTADQPDQPPASEPEAAP